jgi:hypothetical protein
MGGREQVLPRAREVEIVVQELPDEVLVYDLKRHKAHCLNQSAAFVWRRCDGRTSVAEMARLLGEELRAPVSEEVVWLALDRLGKARLLEGRAPEWLGPGLSRREVVRKLGLGAAVALPLIISVTAPTAAQAQTVLLGQGAPCSTSAQCSTRCCRRVCNTPSPGCGPFCQTPAAGFPCL